MDCQSLDIICPISPTDFGIRRHTPCIVLDIGVGPLRGSYDGIVGGVQMRDYGISKLLLLRIACGIIRLVFMKRRTKVRAIGTNWLRWSATVGLCLGKPTVL